MATPLKTVFFAAVTTVALAAPQEASAWQCNFENCPVQCDLPITYAIGDLPAELDETTAIAEIQRAFEAWNAPDCADLGFTYLGRAADVTETATLLISTLDPWPDSLGSATATNVVALTSVDQSGCMARTGTAADNVNIALNGERPWSTDGTNDVDLYTAVLQQIGLHLGIANAPGDPANTVVRAAYTGPIDSGILSEDEAAVCYLYADGMNGPETTPTPETCTTCETEDDCTGGERCLSLFGQSADSVCIAECGANAECPGGGDCYEIADPMMEMMALCLAVANGQPTCPSDEAPGEDMGSRGEPDMGGDTPDMSVGEADMGTGSVPDLGGDEVDAEVDLDDIETSGSGCCAVADGAPDGSLLLLLLAGLGLFWRRR